MTSTFQLVTEAPERAFLAMGCRMALPDEDTLASEIAAQRQLEPGDVKITYSIKEGHRYVSVYGRVVRHVNCANQGWIHAAQTCFKDNQSFDLLNATPTDIALIDKEARAYADWFRWSDGPEHPPKRRFRPLTQTA